VVDPKSKLIQRIKLWHNLQREGKPDMDAQTFIYNQGVPEGLFELPEGMTVVNERQVDESEALFDEGEHLFHAEKKYAEAIEIYRQVYEKFPDLNVAETALMMIGLCHRRLGQHDEEIKAYEKAVSEYPDLKGWIEATYFYLGRAYMDIGQRQKALDAFEKCLAAGQGVRKPEQFPLKDARECIAEIKAAQDNRPSP
ncbi:MAG: tetratricopeptide repeat protein, partial [Planctomycetota bacterium]|jgi:tetratricopeptide (TPR) repeat protein